MSSRLRLLAAIGLAGALSAATQHAQQAPAPVAPAPLREITLDPLATPGTLSGPRTGPLPVLNLDTTGVVLPVSDVWETDPDTGALFRKGEVLVKFRDGVTREVRASAMAAARTDRIAAQWPGGWEQVVVRGGVPAKEALAAFRQDTSVAQVSLNYRATTFQQRPNDEFYSLQWNFDAIDLPRAWEINPGARNDVLVAVIDTGLNVQSGNVLFNTQFGGIVMRFASVPDLVSDGRIVNPRDFVYDDDLPLDLGGHGTHVAGTIGQQTNNLMGVAGVAYNVRLMPLKVISGGSFISWDDLFFPNNPSGSSTIIAEAVRYAADNGARVINMSLGGPGPSPIIAEAIQYAVEKGAFVAIAAGNSAEDGNPVNYPAAYGPEIPGAMTVGAVNRSSQRSEYSSFGSYVEICAPGGEQLAFDDYEGGITQIGYNPVSTLTFLTLQEKLQALVLGFRPRFDRFELVPYQGTSMAAPHVAGVAALLHSQGITSPAAIEEAITRFARPIDATADECGAGLIDPRRTLRGLGLAR